MAKKKSQEQLNLEREVKREQQRIKRRVRDLKRKGYTLPKNIVPEIPKNVTEKTLYRFQQFTSSKIREKSVYTNPTGVTVCGTQHFKETLSERSKKAAQTRREYYKKEPTKTPTHTPANRIDVTLDNLAEEIDRLVDYRMLERMENRIDTWEWTKEEAYWYRGKDDKLVRLKEIDKEKVQGILEGAIANTSREQVARNAMENASELEDLFRRALYESGNKYRTDSRDGQIDASINRIATILYGRSLTPSESEYFSSLGEMLENHDRPQ